MVSHTARVLSDPARLAAIERAGLVGTAPAEGLERASALVRAVLGVPAAFVSIIGEERQFVVAQRGFSDALWVPAESSIIHSYCRDVVVFDRPLVVPDAGRSDLSCAGPLAEAYGIGAYLGVPIRVAEGATLGALCAIDGNPRAWSPGDVETMAALAVSVETELVLRAEVERRTRAEAQARALFDSSPDAVLVLDPATEVVLDANDAACALYGRAHADLVGTSMKAFSRETSRGEAVAARLVAEGGRAQFDTVQVRADGTSVDLRVSASVVDFDGRPALLSVNRDVTDVNRAERRLAEARAFNDRLALVAAKTTNGVIVTDADGLTEWVNEGFTRISGYTLDDLRGRKPGHVLQGPNTDPETVAFLRGQASAHAPFSAELVNVHKNGTPYWIRLEATPLVEDDGTLTGYMAIETDITERRRAEATLRESEAQYRTLVESVRDAVLETDAQGHLTFVNPAWEGITGVAAADSLGRRVRAFVHPDAHTAHDDAVAPLMTGDVGFVRFESRFAHADGSVRHVEIQAERRLDESGARAGLIGTVTDLTDAARFEAEREARRRSEDMLRLKGAFLDNMSHELRTPLTAILGFAAILTEEAGEEQQEWATAIFRAGRRLHDTLNAVLDLSQLEAGTVDVDATPVDVRTVADEVAASLGPLADAGGLGLAVTGGPAVALTDAGALHRALHHVVENAVKFTPAGRVTVDVMEADGRVRVRVADTGVGIPAAFLPTLFDAFTQASQGHDRSHEGSGLGLALTRRLVDLVEGEIAVESAEGVGTTVTLSLPVPSTAPATLAPVPMWKPIGVGDE